MADSRTATAPSLCWILRQFAELLTEQTQGLLAAQNVSAAIHRASTQEYAARQEYIRALGVLTDLTISDQTPSSSSPEQSGESDAAKEKPPL